MPKKSHSDAHEAHAKPADASPNERTDADAAREAQESADAAAKARDAERGKLVDDLWTADGAGYRLHVSADSRELAGKLVEAYTQQPQTKFTFAKPKRKPPHGTPILRGRMVGEGDKARLEYERG